MMFENLWEVGSVLLFIMCGVVEVLCDELD